ncbi:MAG: hypothetical protein KKE05_02665 [Nanoarchaeota archaeon]|nr:hypothetical protein [Nanoarchaeota archaeon]
MTGFLRELEIYGACRQEFVPRDLPLERITYEYLVERTRGVLDAARVAMKVKIFDAQMRERDDVYEELSRADAWRREALRSRDKIRILLRIARLDTEEG